MPKINSTKSPVLTKKSFIVRKTPNKITTKAYEKMKKK
jgi:hypothetical protein